MKRWLRRLLWVVLGLILLAVAGYFAIPPVLSSDWGRKRLAAALERSIDRPVEVRSLTFSWGTGLVVEGFSLGAGDETALTARELRADPDLLSLLGDEMRLRRIEVTGVEVVVVRDAEGRWSVPALEKLRREKAPRGPGASPERPARPARPRKEKEKGESRLARLSVVLAAKDVDVRLLDARRGETLLEDLEATATLEAGAAEIPVLLASETLGFRLAARIRLFEGGRVREAPAAAGTLVLAGADLGRVPGVEGRADGRIEFSGSWPGKVEATVDLRAADLAAPALRIAGEAVVGGKLSFADDALTSPGLAVRLPGAEATITEARYADGALTARVAAKGDPAVLARTLPEVAWPDEVREPFAADLRIGLDSEGWTARIESATTGLRDRALSVSGVVAGDRELTGVRLAEPLAIRWGEIGLRIAGSVAEPLHDSREGRLTLDFEGPLPPEARTEGPFAGRVEVSLAGDGLTLERLELSAAGLDLTASGSVRGLPDRPEGAIDAHLLLDQARLDGWLPEDLPLQQALHELTVRAEARGEAIRVSATDAMRDVLSFGERADSEVRVSLGATVARDLSSATVESLEVAAAPGTLVARGKVERGEKGFSFAGTVETSGDLARLHRLPALAELAPTGRWRSRHEVRYAAEKAWIRGKVTAGDLALANGLASKSAELFLEAESEGRDRVRILEGLLTTVPLSASCYGAEVAKGEDGWGVVGRIDAKGDLARIPPALLPERYREVRATGRANARADLAAGGGGTVVLSGEGIEVLGLPEAKGPLRLESVRASFGVTLGDALEVADPEVTVPAGSIAAKGRIRPGEPVDARIGADLDLGRLAREVPGLFPPELAVAGRVTADLRLAGDLGAGDALGLLSGGGAVAVDRAAWPGYDLEAAKVAWTLEGSTLDLTGGEARLNGGPATFGGTVDLSVDPPAYDLRFDTKDVRLAQKMESEARLLAPFLGDASGFQGRLNVATEGLSARGRGGEEILRNLTGTVRFSLADGVVRGSPLLSSILGWLGEEPDLSFRQIEGKVVFDDGRALTDDLSLSAGRIEMRLSGYAGFDGAIRYAVRVKLPEGAKSRARWLSHLDRDGYLPLNVEGTLSSPKLRPPDAKQVAEGFLDDLLRRALDRSKKDDEKRRKRKKRKKKGADGGGGKDGGDDSKDDK